MSIDFQRGYYAASILDTFADDSDVEEYFDA